VAGGLLGSGGTDNFARGPNLSDGFEKTGNANFTLMFAPSGATGYFWSDDEPRTGNWAFDITGVNGAGDVPEPSSFVIGGVGVVTLLGVSLLRGCEQIDSR
jgi:hypothetical protein